MCVDFIGAVGVVLRRGFGHLTGISTIRVVSVGYEGCEESGRDGQVLSVTIGHVSRITIDGSRRSSGYMARN